MTKLKRMFKRITAFSLAVLLTVVAFPYDSVVYAGPDDYPPEILFPINVYDFPADNLLFEYIADWQYGTSAVSEAGVYFNLVEGPGNNNGKGLVESELGPDGLPVYKRETVERIASYVQGALGINVGAPVLDQPILANGEKNYLSMRNYILSDEWTRIEAEDGTLRNYADQANQIRITNNANCSNNQAVGYVGGPTNNAVEFTYNNNMPGVHRLHLYYMSGDAARGFTVTVNGTSYTLNNLNSGGWNTVGMAQLDVLMEQVGLYTISVTGLNGGWAPDFDYIEIDNGISFEAEDMTLTQPYSIQTSADYSKGQAVMLGGPDSYLASAEETIDIKEAGQYKLQLDRIPLRGWAMVNVIVNGETVARIREHEDGTWHNDMQGWANNNGSAVIPVTLRAGNNTIRITQADGWNLTIMDRFRIYKGGYPLGDYDESKAKFTEDMDTTLDGVQNTRGWTDITTCMDYAYFVTSNLFKYNASLNVQHDDYKQLVFHRVDDDESETPAFEFMADKNHADTKLIYNATNKTVRNVMPDDPGTKEGDVVRNGGSLFLVDDAIRNYPEVDGLKTGGSDNTDHNFGYTVASKSKFVYKKGYNQYFYFSGDDDVYVFVNGKLLVDLGGSHEQLDEDFNLDELALVDEDGDGVSDYGLEDDKVVDLSFFYMERHTVESNFYAKLNFELATDELKHAFDFQTIPYGFLADLNYKFTSMRELNTNKNFTFKDNFGNIIGAEGFQLGEGVSLKDNTLKVVVTKEDGTVDQDRSASFTFYNPAKPTQAELDAIMNYFKDLEITLDESFEISGAQYDTATIPYDDYADTAEEGVNSKSCSFTPTVTYDAWMDGATIPTQNTLTANNPVKVVVGSIKITTSPDADNLKKELVDYGAFELVRTDTKGNQSVLYTNPTYYDGSSVKVVDKLPQDYYTLELDTSVLTGYKVTIKGSSTPVITDAYGNRTKGDTTVYESGDDTRLTILFQPVYDPDTKIWSYPEVIFELKATRDLPDLKDLT